MDYYLYFNTFKFSELDEGCNFLVIENGYFSSQNYISPGSTLVLDCDAGYAPSEAHAKVKCVTGTLQHQLKFCLFFYIISTLASVLGPFCESE